MTHTLNPNITIVDPKRKKHSKASEEYIHVLFIYPECSEQWEGWVPVEYRRTGVSIKTDDELIVYLNKVYQQMNPENFVTWSGEQNLFWAGKAKAETTKSFFDSLIKGGWQCAECTLPKNRNWARRIQDLKEFGYTIATDIKRFCPHCKSNKTHLILLPLERKGLGASAYETWSPALRRKIIRILESFDVYEDAKSPHCLPDHKFPEVRWDEDTKEANSDDMTEAEIRQKFQLMTNQRNQHKREVCRHCYQNGIRGSIFGIPFFYKGSEEWEKSIPMTGKDAEKGCEGCPWYDIAKWREELLKKINR